MKITKTQKAEILQVMDAYWNSYLSGDMQTWASYLPEDYRNIGTTKTEVWNSKKEIVDFTKKVLDQTVGMAEMRNKKTQIIPYDPYIMVHELGDLYVKADEGWVYYAQFRLSSLLGKTTDGWKIRHQHGSYPDSKTDEGEAFAFDELKAENKKLRDAIKRRTIELERNNRELVIEAALERVRARTMAMHSSDELPEAANLLFLEVQALGVPTWSAGYNILSADKSTAECWMSSEGAVQAPFTLYFRKEKSFIEQFDFFHSDESFLIQELNGNALVQHYDYMKTIPKIGEVIIKLENSGISLPTLQINHLCKFKQGYLLFITYESVPESHGLFTRFTRVFEQTYTRFLDLQKAEAQAREAQIEAALERVRAKSLAMHRSEELAGLSSELVKQVEALGVKTWFCAFNIYDDDEKGSLEWGSNSESTFPEYRTPREGIFLKYFEAGQRGEKLFIYKIGKDACPAHYEYLCSLPGVGEQLLQMKEAGLSFPSSQIDHVAFHKYGYILFITFEPVPEAHDIFKRFANVFEQTYTRFLDLQKAEAQAREAQIEGTLEKVRSRTMAMQHSDELPEVANVLFLQVQSLGIPTWSAGYNIVAEDKKSSTCIMSSEGQIQTAFQLPFTEERSFQEWYDAIEREDRFFVQELGGKQLEAHYEYLLSLPGVQKSVDPIEKAGISFPSYQINHLSFFKYGFLLFITYEKVPESHLIFKRFTTVFEQTYARFLDLQTAEAQTREAQIEASLERVRARSMAMHGSDELLEVAELLTNEIKGLGIETITSGYVLIDEETKIGWNYMADPSTGKILPKALGIPHDITENMTGIFENWSNRKPVFVIDMDEQQTFAHQTFIAEKSIDFHLSAEELIAVSPAKLKLHTFNFNQGYLLIVGGQLLSEEQIAVILRFTKVFQQTYTRFLDLKTAEAQTREAQIEAALERIRSRSMAMHSSNELSEVANVMFEQMKMLGGDLFAFGIVLCDKYENEVEQWHSVGEAGMMTPFNVPIDLDYIHRYRYDQWEAGVELFSIEIPSDYIDRHFELMFELPSVMAAMEELEANAIELKPPPWEIDYGASFNNGYLLISSLKPFKEDKIFPRFAKVFEQAYTRFLDLQKAEELAREAKTELALERIRAQATAMKKSEDLLDIVVKMRSEFISLGHEAHYFWHMKWAAKKYLKAMTSGDGTRIGTVMELPRKIHGEIPSLATWEKSDEPTVIHVMDVEATLDYVHKMAKWGDFERVDPNMPTEDVIRHIGGLTYVMARTKHGEIGYSLPGMVPYPPGEAVNTLIRFADTFDLAYRRFEDLQHAEDQAKEAKIEAALERTRAQSMMMQHSDEFNSTSNVFHEQLLLLGLPSEFSYVWLPDEENNTQLYWATWSENNNETITSRNKGYSYPLDKTKPNTAAFFEMWESDEDVFVNHIQPEEVEGYFSNWSELLSEAENLKAEKFPEGLYSAEAYMKYGCFGINIRRPLDEAEQDVLHRFAIEFERTYTRFLDLQNAEKQAQKIKLVNQENERLLHSILPEQIAQQIRMGQRNLVKRFEQASILFGDIVGFTLLSENAKPSEMVKILNGLFSKFDDLTDRYHLEKIKTIGDAYMVAAGVPEEIENHAHTLFQFAQEMLEVTEVYNQENNLQLQMRIGISSGPVVAGVIGKKKFTYDLWGDSVNTAARMEAYGQSGKIQVAPPSYELLKNDFTFVKIPGMEIKGKGIMDVYLWKPNQ